MNVLNLLANLVKLPYNTGGHHYRIKGYTLVGQKPNQNENGDPKTLQPDRGTKRH